MEEDTHLSTQQVVKRLVLRHSTGPLNGLTQILGVAPMASDYPASLTYGLGQQALRHAVRPRYIEYREVR